MNYNTRTANIDLDPGETIRCVFTNRPVDGSIEIIKDTNPETSGISFDFDSSLGGFDLEDDGQQVFSHLIAGSYTFSENEPAGWHLEDIDCGNADVTISLASEQVIVHLGQDEDVVCYFINEPDDPTVTPTATTDDETPGATSTPTRTPIPTLTPSPTPTQVVIVSGTVTPPSTGDGGLASGHSPVLPVAAIGASILVTLLAFAKRRRRSL